MPGRVLIVDDDPEMRDLFTKVLALDGHEVRTTASVEDARALDWPEGPQAILVDAGLARDDIPTLGARLAERWPSGEVIYLVDRSRPELVRQLERGRVRHFVRPFQIEDLRDLVNGIVERHARAEGEP